MTSDLRTSLVQAIAERLVDAIPLFDFTGGKHTHDCGGPKNCDYRKHLRPHVERASELGEIAADVVLERLEHVGFFHREEDACFLDTALAGEGGPDHLPSCRYCEKVYRWRELDRETEEVG